MPDFPYLVCIKTASSVMMLAVVSLLHLHGSLLLSACTCEKSLQRKNTAPQYSGTMNFYA